MILLQETAAQAGHAADAAHGAFEAFGLPLLLLLPLLGFLANGALSLLAARRALPKLPPVGDPHWDAHQAHASEQEHHADAHGEHPADHDAHAHGHDAHDDHGHAHAHRPKPFTHTLPSIIAPGVLLAAFGVALVNFFRMLGAEMHAPHVQTLWSWMPVPDGRVGDELIGGLNVDFALQLDPLSMLMTLIITGVGFLIHVFSIGYMREDPGYPRFMAYLNLFIFFMLTLVLGASYPVMFVGWEGVGLCSYLLIGFWFTEKANADAGKKAFIVNRIGDFGFLIAMFLLWVHVGSLDFVTVMERAPLTLAFGGAVVTAITLFFFLGAAGKSAQIPLYVWLPDAMAGPTPVSALIHAATMVTAGVYLVARSATLFTMAPVSSLVVAVVGTLTAVFAATIGLRQWDIKKVLAYSTVSQLGFMFAAVGMGAYTAGVFHLMTHAFFKACLFLGSGAVIHSMHHAFHATHNPADAQDMRNMGGLRKPLFWTFVTMGIATLAIAGVPPFSGFFSKDEIIGAAWLGAAGHNPLAEGMLHVRMDPRPWMLAIGVILSVTAFITAFYMGRMMIYTFFGRFRGGETERQHLHQGDWTLTLPLILLAVLSTVGGLLNVEEEVPIVGLFNVDGEGGALHRWLHPVLQGSEDVLRNTVGQATEAHHAAWPIFLAIAIGIGGLALAWWRLRRSADEMTTEEPAYRSGGARWLYNKYYVDEGYDRLVVRPTGAVARFLAWLDRWLVDGLVDLAGRLSQLLGLLAGRLQTGQVNTYALVIIVGLLAVLGSFVAR